MTSAPGLVGLTKINLREQALASLRTAITSGQLRPQTPMVETDLSERLNVSRGTLREAMRQLQQEGLVTVGARGRLYVRQLGPKEICDIFAVRAALEAMAAQALADQADSAEAIAELGNLIHTMRETSAADVDLESRIEADLNFHRGLCRLAGNDTLLHTWESLEGSIRMSIMFAGTERAVRNMDVSRHEVIVDAIASGDPKAAARAVNDHMGTAATNLTH